MDLSRSLPQGQTEFLFRRALPSAIYQCANVIYFHMSRLYYSWLGRNLGNLEMERTSYTLETAVSFSRQAPSGDPPCHLGSESFFFFFHPHLLSLFNIIFHILPGCQFDSLCFGRSYDRNFKSVCDALKWSACHYVARTKPQTTTQHFEVLSLSTVTWIIWDD